MERKAANYFYLMLFSIHVLLHTIYLLNSYSHFWIHFCLIQLVKGCDTRMDGKLRLFS